MSSERKTTATRQLVETLNIDHSQVLILSCSTQFGVSEMLAELQKRIESRVKSLSSDLGEAQVSLVTRARHKKHLEETLNALNRFLGIPLYTFTHIRSH